jgi:hypothetical protein
MSRSPEEGGARSRPRANMTNPIVFLNGYLSEMIPQYLEEYGSSVFNYFDDTMRFFPVSPTTIDELTQQLPSASEAPFVVYDRMLRFKSGPFPHKKKEQLIYYFYKTTTKSSDAAMAILIETIQAAEDLLNRGDESAKEINSWIQSKLVNGVYNFGGVDFDPVSFSDTQVFHLQEVRDIIDFGTARTYAGNKMIVDYCYYTLDFNNSTPTTIKIVNPDWRGTWNSSTQYFELDVVNYSGASWVALDQNINKVPGQHKTVWRRLVTSVDNSEPLGILSSVVAYNIPSINLEELGSNS